MRILVSLAFAILLTPLAAWPQSGYPAKAVRIVVPYPARGGSDYVARLFAERLAKSLGQPVIVDNRSGAIGTAGVAKAEGDGHTLLFSIGDPLVNNVVLFKNFSHDPREDFAFIAQVLRSPALISANTDLPIKSFEEFRRYAATRVGKLIYGSWGIGGLGHLAGESLNRELGARMIRVRQRGEGPVVNDLLTKTIAIGLSSVGTAKPHALAGKLVPLAVMGRERSAALPNVPTLRELGFADPIYERSVWMGFLAPAKTPPAVVRRLAADIVAIAASPEVSMALVERGFEMMVMQPTGKSSRPEARTTFVGPASPLCFFFPLPTRRSGLGGRDTA